MIKRFLLSRRTVLVLIVALLLLIFVSFLVPQRSLFDSQTIAAWEVEHASLLTIVQFLGLDHVFSSALFLVLICVFLFALLLSLVDQIKKAFIRTTGKRKTTITSHDLVTEFSLVEVAYIIKKKELWILRPTNSKNTLRLVRNPWGYWGNSFLHLGMVVVIVGSFFVAFTERHGQVKLMTGEEHSAGIALPFQNEKISDAPFSLPFSIRLDATQPFFWENDDTRDLVTKLTVTRPSQSSEQVTVGINRVRNIDGIRIYQRQKFGNAFYVLFKNPDDEVIPVVFDLPFPKKRDVPAYGEFYFPGIQYKVWAKYYADVSHNSMYDVDPELTIRLMDNERVVDELTLRTGQGGNLGSYQVLLDKTSRWAVLIFVKHHGMPLVFLGFFLIIAGAFLVFCTPPRELYLFDKDGQLSIGWRAGRMSPFFQEEPDRIINKIYKYDRDHGTPSIF